MENLIKVFRTFNEHPSRNAITYRTGVRRLNYTYGELYDFSLKMANWLDRRGIKKGDRITLWAPNSPWWAVTFWASVIRGIIIVPVDFSSNQERAKTIAKLTESKLIIQSNYKLDRIHSPLAFPIDDLELELSETEPGTIDYEPTEDRIVELIYTSGTTGNPKGVILTHRNICTNLEQVRNLAQITEDYRFLSMLPLSHMFEQTAGFITPLACGGSIVYILTLKPSSLFEAFAEEDIRAAIIVPRLLQSLKIAIERELGEKHLMPTFNFLSRLSSDWSYIGKQRLFHPITKKFGRNFKFFVSGGSALSPEVAKFWAKLGFPAVEGYGLTECSPVLTANTPEKQVLGSVGTPVKGVEIRISDKDILAKGPNIFPGYWNNPEATANAFTEDGWFKTGDCGELDENGYLYIRGRKKDMIVTPNGMNVYADDVEGVLNKIPGVKDSCILSVGSPQGEQVHAVLILRGSIDNPEELIKSANSMLEEHQRIMGFTIWPEAEFPKTTTLKIQKFKVKEMIAHQASGSVSRSFDEIQSMIAQITGVPIEEVTEKALLVDDLGLSSIARLELVSLIEQKFRLDMDDSQITPQTTVGDIRKIIEKRERVKNRNIFWFWTNSGWAKSLRMLRDALLYPPYSLLAPATVHGLEKLADLNEPVVFISNHTSYLDQPVIMYAMPRRHRYNTATAAWQEFFFDESKNIFTRKIRKLIFLYAAIMRNIFPLPQSSGFKKTLAYMGKLIDHKINFLIFPEGRMSRDGNMSPFMQGLGMMVKELQVTVVPIYIANVGKVLPPDRKFPTRHAVDIWFGDPLRFKRETSDEILQKCEDSVIALSKQK